MRKAPLCSNTARRVGSFVVVPYRATTICSTICSRVPHNSLCGGDESTCRRPRITMLRYRIIISTSWQVRAPLCTPRQPPLRQALGLPGPPRGLRTGGRSAPPVAPPPSLTCSPSPPHQSVHLPLVARTAPHIMCTCACAHFSLSLSLQVELPAHVAAVRRSAVCACVCVCVCSWSWSTCWLVVHIRHVPHANERTWPPR